MNPLCHGGNLQQIRLVDPNVAQRPLKPALVQTLTVGPARALGPISVAVTLLTGSGVGPTGTGATEPVASAGATVSTGVADVRALRAPRMM